MGSNPKTIAIDFDGVIHKYSKGWQDGSIYDNEVEDVFKAIETLFKLGYCVFIFSTRKPRQIKQWLIPRVMESDYIVNGMGGDPTDYSWTKYGFKVERIGMFTKFWNKKNVLGITNRKLAAHCYIDDRALKFEGDWISTLDKVFEFKTYQNV